MNQNPQPKERENDSEDYMIKKNKKGNFAVLIVCVFLAFFLWLVIRNNTDTTKGTDTPSTEATQISELKV